jgi:hypothetical protein
VTTNDWNTSITATVTNSPVPDGSTTQYVCTGWAGSGSVTNGSGTNTTFNITNNTAITWQWVTNYMLTTDVTNGILNVASGWAGMGSNITITVTPTNGYHLAQWTGTTNDCSTNANQITVPMDGARWITAVCAIDVFNITASAGPDGTIAPSGVVQVTYGSSTNFAITVTNAHYHISDVVVDGGSIGPTNTYTFANVTSNHSIMASFAIDTYTLGVTTSHGTVIPSGVTTNAWNTNISAIAVSPVPDGSFTQYVCIGWAGSGSVTNGSGTNTSFNITNDSTLAWQWVTNYMLTVDVTNGTLNVASGWYPKGTNVTIIATPTNNHHFGTWAGTTQGCTIAGNQIIVPMDQARWITAICAIDTFSITAWTTDTNGIIAPSGTVQVAYGGSTNFTMTPNTNHHVADVLVDAVSVGPSNTYTFINVTNSHTIAASFAIDMFTLTVNTAHGTATPAGTTTNAWNTNINALVVSPAYAGSFTQYVCTGWTGSGSVTNGSGTNTSFNITNNSVLTWQWVTNYTLTTDVTNGVLDVASGWVGMGSNVTINVTPIPGYHLAQWTGTTNGCSTNANQITVPMDQARWITAVCAQDPPPFLTVISPYGVTMPSGVTSNPAGSTVDAVAISPAYNGSSTQYFCTGWTGTGSVMPTSGVGTNVSFVITNNSVLTWHWTTNLMLSISATNGTVNATNGWHSPGTNIVITATPTNGYLFAYWAGTVSGCARTGNQITVFMDRSRWITAVFETNKGSVYPPIEPPYSTSTTYQITASAGAHGTITPNGIVTVPSGGVRNFMIMPDTYWLISDVIVDGGSVGTVSNYSFYDVTTDHTISASFALNTTTNIHSVPIWWLNMYYGVTDYAAVVEMDTDKDGMVTWKEYVSGTVPTDSNSVFKIIDCYVSTTSNRIVWLGGNTSLPPFDIFMSTNLMATSGGWFRVTNCVRSVTGTNQWDDYTILPRNVPRFYRITATNSP